MAKDPVRVLVTGAAGIALDFQLGVVGFNYLPLILDLLFVWVSMWDLGLECECSFDPPFFFFFCLSLCRLTILRIGSFNFSSEYLFELFGDVNPMCYRFPMSDLILDMDF